MMDVKIASPMLSALIGIAIALSILVNSLILARVLLYGLN